MDTLATYSCFIQWNDVALGNNDKMLALDARSHKSWLFAKNVRGRYETNANNPRLRVKIT